MARKSKRVGADRAPGRRRTARSTKSRAAASRPATMANDIGFVSHHLDYTSHDIDAIKRFYTETLGFTRSEYDARHEYLFVETSKTSSLGFMPPGSAPPEQWRPPSEPKLYFMVEDVDRVHRELVAKGVEFDEPPADMDWGHRVARLRDPEGRIICFAEEIKR